MVVMNPTVPVQPSVLYLRETSPRCPAMGASVQPSPASIASYDSIHGTSSRSFHPFPLNGMYSMNRTSTGLSTAIAANRGTSSSLTPRITTQLTFTRIPASRHWSMLRRTRSNPFRRVTNSNLCASSVSRLMLMFVIPHSDSTGSFFARLMPLVVMQSCSTPFSRTVARPRARSSKSRRTSGSPPVRRILRTPSSAKMPAARTISAVDIKSSAGVRSTPSAGMQYWHRRLHRSVMLIRR
eukprot:gene14259-biopygen14313